MKSPPFGSRWTRLAIIQIREIVISLPGHKDDQKELKRFWVVTINFARDSADVRYLTCKYPVISRLA